MITGCCPITDYLIIDAGFIWRMETKRSAYRVSNRIIKENFEELGSPKNGALGNLASDLAEQDARRNFTPQFMKREDIIQTGPLCRPWIQSAF